MALEGSEAAQRAVGAVDDQLEPVPARVVAAGGEGGAFELPRLAMAAARLLLCVRRGVGRRRRVAGGEQQRRESKARANSRRR